MTEHPYNSSTSDVEARGTVKDLIKDTPCWGSGGAGGDKGGGTGIGM